MKYDLRVGQHIRCKLFEAAMLHVRSHENAPPVIDQTRIHMESGSTLYGAWHEQLGDNTYKVHSYSLDRRTGGRFGHYDFEVIAVNLITPARSMDRSRAIVAEASTNVRILFYQGECTGHIEPEQIELLAGPPDEHVEPIW